MIVSKKQEIKKTRRGTAQYTSNPFLTDAVQNAKSGVRRITNKDGNRMMVVSEQTGEVIAPAGFWQAEEVDKSQFVKLYVNGVKGLKDLTGAGTKVFELLYLEIQKNIGKDRVYLSFSWIDQSVTPMSESTFMRGMKELVLKGFIAATVSQGWFFINPDYIWNGDRLAFIKEFRMKKPKGKKDTATGDLFALTDESTATE